MKITLFCHEIIVTKIITRDKFRVNSVFERRMRSYREGLRNSDRLNRLLVRHNTSRSPETLFTIVL